MPIFDTHAHYDSNGFAADRDEILSALPAAGVGLVVDPGCELESSRAALALAERYPFVYAAVGIHPSDCAGTGEAEFAALRKLCGHEKVVAVGEIGLDYYWKDNPSKEFQQTVFRRQIELAIELDLPVIVHDREAHGDSLAIVLDYPEARGVFHCFSGSPEMAEELLKRGWYLGFDGPITYKNAQKARRWPPSRRWTASWWRRIPPTSRRCPSGGSGTTAGICPISLRNWRNGRACPRKR